jgi:hypothetical protein
MQVNSEFQAFKHVEILGPGEHMRAQQPLEATLAIHPTVVLTNALPYPMHLILWQVLDLFHPVSVPSQLLLVAVLLAVLAEDRLPNGCTAAADVRPTGGDQGLGTCWHLGPRVARCGAQVAPLHRGQKQAPALKRTASSPARSSGSVDISADIAAAAAAGPSASQASGPASQDHARRLQELAAVLSGTLPMGPEDNLLLEELLRVRQGLLARVCLSGFACRHDHMF